MEDDTLVMGTFSDGLGREAFHHQRVGVATLDRPSDALESDGQYPGSGGSDQSRRVAQLFDRPCRHQPALVDDDEIVGEQLDFAEEVARYEHSVAVGCSRCQVVTKCSDAARIEAKKQRRRDGRDAGRRRAPILTEAEFLARRESVNRVMCVREHGDRTQIAVLEDGILVEHYVNRAESSSMVGNVYLGKVQNVLPSMEAAFT